MEDDFLFEEEGFWKCRKHPSRPRSGVCPSCLRDRLLLLCPDCANLRPCSCLPSSSSSSSFSSHSSFDPARSSVSGAVGAIGRVSSLIESESAFRRSRSVALPFMRRRPGPEAAERAEKGRKLGSFSFWGFLKTKDRKGEVQVEVEEEEERRSEIEKLSRSRSVGFPIYSSSSSTEGRLKGKKWHFPSPMRAFRPKKTAKSFKSDRRCVAVDPFVHKETLRKAGQMRGAASYRRPHVAGVPMARDVAVFFLALGFYDDDAASASH